MVRLQGALPWEGALGQAEWHSPKKIDLLPEDPRAMLDGMHITDLSTFVLLSVVLGFGGAVLMGACAVAFTPEEAACSTAEPEPPAEEPTTCGTATGEPCMRYRIELLGNPSMDPVLRAKYKARLGSACYVAATNNTFNCYYEDPIKACKAVLLVPVAFGAADYEDHPETCKAINATLWSLQTGPDPANLSYIYYENAPVETSLIDVDGGAPLAVNGPYRNLPQKTTIKAGGDFDCKTGIPGPDGGTLEQREWILQINRAANGGKIRSDLAGFTYPCKTGCPELCTEPEFLNEPPTKVGMYDAKAARVHHVVRRKDLRRCDWGTNANGNAAVISEKLNRFLWYKYPAADEVNQINNVPPYTP